MNQCCWQACLTTENTISTSHIFTFISGSLLGREEHEKISDGQSDVSCNWVRMYGNYHPFSNDREHKKDTEFCWTNLGEENTGRWWWIKSVPLFFSCFRNDLFFAWLPRNFQHLLVFDCSVHRSKFAITSAKIDKKICENLRKTLPLVYH